MSEASTVQALANLQTASGQLLAAAFNQVVQALGAEAALELQRKIEAGERRLWISHDFPITRFVVAVIDPAKANETPAPIATLEIAASNYAN